MKMYPTQLPTTGTFVYCPQNLHEAWNKADKEASYANLSRARLRDALKRYRHEEVKDTLDVIKSLEEYLPHMFIILRIIELEDIKEQENIGKDLIFSWRSVISANTLNISTRTTLHSIYTEALFILVTYSLALTIFASTRSVTQEEQATQARIYFCRAAGIMSFAGKSIIPHLPADNPALPELNLQVLTAFQKFQLAEAQLYAIKNTISQKHSPSLLCRIAISSSDNLSTARSMIMKIKDVSITLKNFWDERRKLAYAIAFKYLAIDFESHNEVGKAISCLEVALDNLKTSSKSKIVQKIGMSDRNLSLLSVEQSEISKLHSTFSKLNNTVSFQPVSKTAQILEELPSGRDFLFPVPFEIPQPLTEEPTNEFGQDKF